MTLAAAARRPPASIGQGFPLSQGRVAPRPWAGPDVSFGLAGLGAGPGWAPSAHWQSRRAIASSDLPQTRPFARTRRKRRDSRRIALGLGHALVAIPQFRNSPAQVFDDAGGVGGAHASRGSLRVGSEKIDWEVDLLRWYTLEWIRGPLTMFCLQGHKETSNPMRGLALAAVAVGGAGRTASRTAKNARLAVPFCP